MTESVRPGARLLRLYPRLILCAASSPKPRIRALRLHTPPHRPSILRLSTPSAPRIAPRLHMRGRAAAAAVSGHSLPSLPPTCPLRLQLPPSIFSPLLSRGSGDGFWSQAAALRVSRRSVPACRALVRRGFSSGHTASAQPVAYGKVGWDSEGRPSGTRRRDGRGTEIRGRGVECPHRPRGLASAGACPCRRPKAAGPHGRGSTKGFRVKRASTRGAAAKPARPGVRAVTVRGGKRLSRRW